MRSRATTLIGTAVRRIGLGPSQIHFDAWVQSHAAARRRGCRERVHDHSGM